MTAINLPRRPTCRATRIWAAAASLILAVSVAACGSSDQPAATGDKPLEKVTLVFDYLMDVMKAPIVLGVERGFFREQGIDLDYVEGSGSANSVKFVANGRYMFGFASSQAAFTAASKGIPVKAIAVHLPQGQVGVSVRADGPIQDVKDLEGRTVVTPQGSSESLILPFWLEAAGVDPAKVKINEVQAGTNSTVFLRGGADALDGTFDGLPAIFNVDPELKVRWFPAAKYGFNIMDTMVITQADRIAKNPDLVKRFVAAYAKSYLYAYANLDELIEVTTAEYGDVRAEDLRGQWAIDRALVASPATTGHPFGYIGPEDVESTIKALAGSGQIKGSLNPDQVYTNEFIGDWDPMQASGGDIGKLAAEGGIVTKELVKLPQ